MNSKQRNYIKQQIEELKVNNWSLTSGQLVWIIVGIVTLITFVGPWFSFGYVKKYQARKVANRERIRELEQKLIPSS